VSEGAQKKAEKPRKFQAIRGTRDLLPPDTDLWNRVERTAHDVFGTFGFGEIRPPIFEATELFARGVGGSTDIVSKEMYSFIDNPAASSFAAYRDQAFQWYEALRIDRQRWPAFISAVTSFSDSLENARQHEQLFFDSEAQSQADSLKQLLLKHQELSRSTGSDTSTEETVLFRQMLSKMDILILGERVALRPEATASVCRAYIEHNMQQWPQPVKLYYIGPMFRRERPQKGRYRQFYQIGAEVLETVRPDAAKDASKELAKDAAVDAEVIEMLMTFFDRCGLENTTLYINSIGHTADN
jgi:histidyl-tRNA synthetase